MGRPPKIEYVDLDNLGNLNPPKVRAVKIKYSYELGQVFKSSSGHEATVIGVSDEEITFGFTRTFKGETEPRQRSVPVDRVDFFLKAYR